ncbi:GIY-YIG nuclease family protein, partial [bacterium]|nr:GIY-YIG nuclease family protein [bacterium]
MSDLFPPKSESNPIIYAYTLLDDTSRQGQLKVGFTTRSAKERIQEQIGATLSRFTTVVDESAMRSDGSSFSDHDVHRQLKKDGFINTEGEWFRCKTEDVVSAIIAVRDG